MRVPRPKRDGLLWRYVLLHRDTTAILPGICTDTSMIVQNLCNLIDRGRDCVVVNANKMVLCSVDRRPFGTRNDVSHEQNDTYL